MTQAAAPPVLYDVHLLQAAVAVVVAAVVVVVAVTVVYVDDAVAVNVVIAVSVVADAVLAWLYLICVSVCP